MTIKPVEWSFPTLNYFTVVCFPARSGESNQETDVAPTLISPISDTKKQKDGNQTKEKSTPPPPQGPFIYEFAYFAR